MYKTLGGIAAAVILAASVVPGTAAAQESGFHKQVAGVEFSSQRRYYRRYYVRRYWAPPYYISNYNPYFYYAQLHFYAPPPGLRYYGPPPGYWW